MATKGSTMKLSDYVMRFLEEKAVDTMFYLPGGGCMHLLDSMASSTQINSISLLHEQALAIAAEAYANTSGKMGVALATTGPGAANTITGMLGAYLDSSPVFFITGQVKTADLKSHFGVRGHGSQEADIVAIVSSITKYAVMVTDKSKIRYHLERAWYEAMIGRRGPVLLDIPLDIQGAQIEPDALEGFTPPPSDKTPPDVSVIINMLRDAKRPVLIVGNGCTAHKNDFFELMDLLSIPVIPSWKAMDYIANDHPLYAGRAGGMGDRHGNLTMQNADLILSMGCRLDFSITGFDRSAWATKAKKIIVEIDPAEIKKFLYNPQKENDSIPHKQASQLNELNEREIFPVIAGAGKVMKELLRRKSEIKVSDISSWKKQIAQWKEKYPLAKEHQSNSVTTYSLIDTLCAALKNDAFVAPCSSGTTAEIFFQTFTVKAGQTVRSNHGLGSMGFEIPNAIGMCVASGKKNTVCIAGDGGMQLNIQELAVIRGHNLPIKIFIVNNNGYASIRNMQNNHFQGRHKGCDADSGLFLPDMQKLSAAYQIPYCRVENLSGLEYMVKSMLLHGEPAICEVFVEGDCLVTPRSASQIMPDGSMRSSPLENQFPFLPDGEIKANMV
ncbi:MAG: biosynthetic-type acetolactate synthase large subunit [Termitinemataceae bacterium]|nr:MAG: biosynthetic-type acetolactate synthase large subunit [Termitinemataceae bacterium]